MGNSLVKTKKSHLEIIQSNINSLIDSKAKALPKGFNKTRFVQNAMTVLLDTPKINEMQPISVARTILKGAFLGLDFFRKECYAIPYGSSLNFQTDYKGDVKIAKQFSLRPIEEIYAKVVREGDEFTEYCENGKQGFAFKPIAFSNKPIIGAFATVIFKDGEILVETMSAEEIENIRTSFSKAPNSAAWKNTPGEMYKKTVLKRLCKNIPLEFTSLEEQLSYSTADNVTYEKNYDDKIFSDNPDIIDVPHEDVKKTVKSVDVPVEQQTDEPEIYNDGEDDFISGLKEVE